MGWSGWATIAFTVSACVHLAASLWVMNLEESPIKWNKETTGPPLSPSYPIRLVQQYTLNFLKDGFPMQLWKITTAAVCIPFVVACLVLIGTIVVLAGLPIYILGLWDQLRFKRMKPEQRQATNIAREEKLLPITSEVRPEPRVESAIFRLH